MSYGLIFQFIQHFCANVLEPLRIIMYTPSHSCYCYLYGCRYGGWVIDGFPVTRDNWASMTESNLLPDFILHLEDSHSQTDYLLKRFTDLHGFPLPADVKINAKKDSDQV